MSAAKAAVRTPPAKGRVLIVDDEPGVLESIAGVLDDEGYSTLTASNGVEGLELFEAERPDMVLLDIWLPDRDGLEVLRALRERDPEARVVMISGHGTVSTAVKAIKMGAHHYLEKPVSYEQLVETVDSVLTVDGDEPAATDDGADRRSRIEDEMTPPPMLSMIKSGRKHQRTIRQSTVIYGLGLHSGKRTGMVLQPLP
ncbi:MAG: response regulator, partial [Acidobacteriota bacterium]